MKQLRTVELKRFLRKNKLPAKDIVLVLDSLQYAKNVAQLFRIADAMAVRTIYLTGATTTPPFGKDLRKVSRSKEDKIVWKYYQDPTEIINSLKSRGYRVTALEITDESASIYNYKTPDKLALVVGSEAHGVSPKVLEKCSDSIFIPMMGKGASLNVAVSTGIALSHLLKD